MLSVMYFLAADVKKQKLIEKFKELKVWLDGFLILFVQNQLCLMILYLTNDCIRNLANLSLLWRKRERRMLQKTIDMCHIDVLLINETHSINCLFLCSGSFLQFNHASLVCESWSKEVCYVHGCNVEHKLLNLVMEEHEKHVVLSCVI